MVLKIALLFTLIWATAGCADQAAIEALQKDLENMRTRVAEAKAERAKYGEGSPLFVLVSARLAADELTLSMLEQKGTALRWYPRFTFTVEGQKWTPPADAEVQLRAAMEELKEAQADAMRARSEAASMGGLIGVLAVLKAEMKAIPAAQLEYQVMALRHNFPVYAMPKVPIKDPAK
jgi:hypothetical protein